MRRPYEGLTIRRGESGSQKTHSVFWGAPRASPSSTGLLLLMQGEACLAPTKKKRLRRGGFSNPPALRAVEELGRIDRRCSLADLKVELRSIHVARLARVRNHLPAFDLVAALDQKLLGVRVSGYVTVGMPHQDGIAV